MTTEPSFLAMAKTAGEVTNRPVHSAEAAYALAGLLVGSSMLPPFIKCWQDIVLLVLHGADLGFGPMEALRELVLVEGRVSVSARGQLKLLLRSGVKLQWLSDGTDGVEAALELQLPNDSVWHRASYTAKEAQTAGLLSKAGAWSKHPAAMLRARCVTKACAMHAPHLVGVHLTEELVDGVEDAVVVERPRGDTFLLAEAKKEWGEAAVNESLSKQQAAKAAAKEWWSQSGPTLVDACKRAREGVGPAEANAIWQLIEEWVGEHAQTIHRLPGHSTERKKVWDWLLKTANAIDMPLEQLHELFATHGIWSQPDLDAPSVDGVGEGAAS